MTKRVLASSISTEEIRALASMWILDGESLQFSQKTLDLRKIIADNLLWWCDEKKVTTLDQMTVRQFLSFLRQPGERWGNKKVTTPASPRTSQIYYSNLRSLFQFCSEQKVLDISPMETIKRPINRPSQIQPFTQEHLTALLKAAETSRSPRRNKALLLFLLDTGIRAGELTSLNRSDLDMQSKTVLIRAGKGNKNRNVYISATTSRAIWDYLRAEEMEPNDPLFCAEGGSKTGERLTRTGLTQLIKRLGVAAGIQAQKCSPHVFRHTCAIEMLREGSNVFALQQLLGHTTLDMTKNYIALAQSDLQKQHRQHSPVEKLRNRKK